MKSAQTAIDFSKCGGLVPAIVRDAGSGMILMLGFMDSEAWNRTRQTGYVWFWSRTRRRLWMKGETSGNTLRVVRVTTDCDRDTLLLDVQPRGTAVCHTGNRSCFDSIVYSGGES